MSKYMRARVTKLAGPLDSSHEPGWWIEGETLDVMDIKGVLLDSISACSDVDSEEIEWDYFEVRYCDKIIQMGWGILLFHGYDLWKWEEIK